jgi:hypothetical protein
MWCCFYYLWSSEGFAAQTLCLVRRRQPPWSTTDSHKSLSFSFLIEASKISSTVLPSCSHDVFLVAPFLEGACRRAVCQLTQKKGKMEAFYRKKKQLKPNWFWCTEVEQVLFCLAHLCWGNALEQLGVPLLFSILVDLEKNMSCIALGLCVYGKLVERQHLTRRPGERFFAFFCPRREFFLRVAAKSDSGVATSENLHSFGEKVGRCCDFCFIRQSTQDEILSLKTFSSQ